MSAELEAKLDRWAAAILAGGDMSHAPEVYKEVLEWHDERESHVVCDLADRCSYTHGCDHSTRHTADRGCDSRCPVSGMSCECV